MTDTVDITKFQCDCPLVKNGLKSGFCDRHNTLKSSRELQICKGEDESVSESLRTTFLADWGEKIDLSDDVKVAGRVANLRALPEVPVSKMSILRNITSEDVPCEFRGGVLKKVKCDVCGNRGKTTTVFNCTWEKNASKQCTLVNSVHGIKACQRCEKGQDAFEDALLNAKSNKLPHRAVRKPSPFIPASDKPRFITKQQFAVDIHRLSQQVPPEVSRIIAVARSGLAVGSMLAMYLHLPLEIVRQNTGDLVDAGNGWRLTGNTGGSGPPLVVDDTCMSGNSFKHVMPLVKNKYPEAISACIYCNPGAHVKPDMYVHALPWPHFLEWNMFNSVNTESLALDFDGVLCRDCHPHEDDDGENYLNFIRTATPMYPVRKVTVPLIVTARLNKYRKETKAWLARNGISVKKLVMAPWSSLDARRRQDMGDFKAKHFKRFMAERHMVKPPAFVESCPHQARRIHEITGGVVICPSTGECHARS